jgi:hypothetical protein
MNRELERMRKEPVVEHYVVLFRVFSDMSEENNRNISITSAEIRTEYVQNTKETLCRWDNLFHESMTFHSVVINDEHAARCVCNYINLLSHCVSYDCTTPVRLVLPIKHWLQSSHLLCACIFTMPRFALRLMPVVSALGCSRLCGWLLASSGNES